MKKMDLTNKENSYLKIREQKSGKCLVILGEEFCYNFSCTAKRLKRVNKTYKKTSIK